MRKYFALTMVATFALAAAPSIASFGGGSRDEPAHPAEIEQRQAPTPRQEAERYYTFAYDEVAKANKDLADQKKKNADKHFKKALDRGERAVELDSTYHEAWNLAGYCARNLGQFDRSLKAYTRCLTIKPEYAPAREYLGELYVEMGDVAKAREQLAQLTRLDAADGAKTLQAKIDAWLVAHPGADAESAPPAAPSPPPAAADSTAGHGSGGSSP